MNADFQNMLKEEFEKFVLEQRNKFPEAETLKIDLHCHDLNSDVPDELIGRILNVPETWLPSDRLIKRLRQSGCDTFTITNHNNATSCFALQDQGFDILTGAEYSCRVPDFDAGIHVLAYGFTPEQAARLEKLRKNLYLFLQYAHLHRIPTVWAHPLYHYSAKKSPPPAFFNKMLLVFERFEAVNGQRDTWQNLLVGEWIGQASEEQIARYAKVFDVDLLQYCSDPYRKAMSGGSDCHMGIFAGMTGTYLHVLGLQARLKRETRSQLALEAIRNGRMAPFGTYQNVEKMTIAFLDYVCQAALNYRDPGLVRMLLHKGSPGEKLISFVVSNLLCEVQRHRVTTSFIRIFHDSMMGEKPPFFKKPAIKAEYRPIFDEMVRIAGRSEGSGEQRIEGYYDSILKINRLLYGVLAGRLEKKLKKSDIGTYFKDKSLEELTGMLELPTTIRSYSGNGDKGKGKRIDISGFLDGLSFPFFGALFILAAHFTGAKTMFNARPLLRDFSRRLGKYGHPQRVFWLTDTFGDGNGVSIFLEEMLAEIRQRDLPVDIVVCSSSVRAGDHLLVLPPVGEFSLPVYDGYVFAIPDFVELHNLFLSGGYDRIICSTEGVMGLSGLYLKHACTVEASFYMHTDWLMFARKALHMEGRGLSRIRRMLRLFYRAFDNVLVLNSDQKSRLSGAQFNLNPDRIHRTAHWANAIFKPAPPDRKRLFGISEDHFVLLYVGRISEEKGVMELTKVYEEVRRRCEKVKPVFVGKGPALQRLKEENPDAVFIDWVSREQLPEIYSSADLLVLPSRFDTFGNVVLEALSCGLPVVACNAKGPRDIIRDGRDGFLVNSCREMQERIVEYITCNRKEAFRRSAAARAADYRPETIIAELLRSVGLD
jgi:glycosyltransferase involved in cell wall biosynthesis